MKTPLIPKGSNFNQNYETVMLKIQSIRKKNDQYQILCGQNLDSAMAQEILEEKDIIDTEILELRRVIDEMQMMFKEPPQRSKLKEAKKDYEKQLSRYKQVSETLMEKSVIKAEMRDSYRKSIPSSKPRPDPRSDGGLREVRPKRKSAEIAKEEHLDMDYDMEHDVLMSRKKELGQVQEHMERVYQIHLDQQNMVHEQGQMVDIIGEEMLKAQENVENTNEQLTSAQQHQKKSRRKCCGIVFLVMLILLAGGGIFYMFVFNK